MEDTERYATRRSASPGDSIETFLLWNYDPEDGSPERALYKAAESGPRFSDDGSFVIHRTDPEMAADILMDHERFFDICDGCGADWPCVYARAAAMVAAPRPEKP